MKKIIALVLALVMVLSLSTVAFAGEAEKQPTLLSSIVTLLTKKYNKEVDEIKIGVKEFVDFVAGKVDAWDVKVDEQGTAAELKAKEILYKVDVTLVKIGEGIQKYLKKSIVGMPHQDELTDLIDDGATFVWNNYKMVRDVVENVADKIADTVFYFYGVQPKVVAGN